MTTGGTKNVFGFVGVLHRHWPRPDHLCGRLDHPGPNVIKLFTSAIYIFLY